MKKLRISFFASHNGSNMQAIVDACRKGTLDAVPVLVISNNSESGALTRAKSEGIPFRHFSLTVCRTQEILESSILDSLLEVETDLIVLAGYMKLLPQKVVAQFRNRILNVHPALLPKFGGKGFYGKTVHQAVLDSKEKVTGATVHLVDEKYDSGRVLAQKKVPVVESDTVESLSAKVLQAEHELFVETIRCISTGDIVI